MLNIEEELRQLYKQSNVYKALVIYFPELDLTITNKNIKSESFELIETLCSDGDIELGACCSAYVKFTIADINQELVGQKFTIVQLVEGYTMPLGTYTVDSCKKQSDKRFKDITAFDSMLKSNTDVSEWYNALSFPITIKQMRYSLLDYLQVNYELQDLPNDHIKIEKTINPSRLVGRELLSKLVQLNGGFGHITRENKFKVILISGLGLYPSETLYPSEDLFPSEPGEFITSGYRSVEFEDYIVEPITAIKIQDDDEDYGTMAGTDKNIYSIIGNYLLSGKNSTELQEIAEKILLVVKNKYYIPHKTVLNGLPYIEVGDAINIITRKDAVESFVFQRRMKGIQSLVDEIEATGNQFRRTTSSPRTELQQLKGKTLKIVKSIDELSSTMTNIEEGLESKITQTAGQLQTQITDNKNDLQSQITQTAGQLQTQITDNQNDLQSQITQTSTEIRQEVTDNKNLLQGQISLTASGLQTQITDNKNSANSQISQLSGQISFKVSKGDVSSQLSIESDKVTFNSNRLIINSTNLKLDANGNAVFSGLVQGAKLISEEGTSKTTIERGIISTTYINISQGNNVNTTLMDSGVLVSDKSTGRQTNVTANEIKTTNVSCVTMNGNTPIHSGNISQQSIGYASSSGNSQYLGYTVYISSNSNMIPNTSGVYCGTSGNPFAGGYATGSWATTSDERKKNNISDLDDRFVYFAKMITPRMFQMFDGTSGRYHTGLIAQEVEQAMIECNISDIEFAGLVKSPRYAIRLFDGEYDTASEIIDYDYFLRYEEFIPLLFLLFKDINK